MNTADRGIFQLPQPKAQSPSRPREDHVNSDQLEYHFSQEGMFVIPIEYLSMDGVDAAFATELEARGALDKASIQLFEDAFRLYWLWAAKLHALAPTYWSPPRVQHVCVVTAPDDVRPYYQPFNKNSWLLYDSDFHPETSSPELAAYHFLHVERMGLLQEIEPVMIANLGCFLALDETTAEGFVDGCRRTTRPDAPAFEALADALPSIRRIFHETLRPPEAELPGAMPIPNTGVIVGQEEQPVISNVHRAWSEAAIEVLRRHHAAHAQPASDGGERIAEWLASARPSLLITGSEWRILWDPDAPDQLDNVRAALAGVTEHGASGILEDLKVVDACSRRFLSALAEPDALVDPAPYITEGGLSYIHKDRKLIAYHVGPGENEGRLWQATPPYERYMLAARTIHEWGHLAAESDWIVVPEARKAERKALRGELEALLETIHDEAPPPVQKLAAQEVEQLEEKSGSVGKALVRGMLIRIEDYQSNLLAKNFLSPDEMDTYVRNNVSAHVQEYSMEAIYGQLTRHAYEIQYLRLSRIEDPLDWFYKSTWFVERFVRGGIITRERFEELVELIGKICDCYWIDESKLDFSDS